MTFLETAEAITEVAQGFKFLAESAQELEHLADEVSVPNMLKGIDLLKEMNERTVEIDSLLVSLHELDKPEVIELAHKAVQVATKGKEEYVIVAGLLTGGLSL